MRPSLLALLLAGITAASLSAQEYVWMEGEAPTRATVKFETGAARRNREEERLRHG